MAHLYIIEASRDRISWQKQAQFEEGQRSRFDDAPFDAQIALKEAQSFKQVRHSDFPYVRVIIEV